MKRRDAGTADGPHSDKKIQSREHRVDLGFLRGCNFYGIRARSHASSFYKIRPGILEQLLRNKIFFSDTLFYRVGVITL
jgi:hypothetical protein